MTKHATSRSTPRGRALLRDPRYTHGTAFTTDERAALGLEGLLLYFRLLQEHLKEMLPVVYDPIVAQAIERYSHEYRRPDGVYFSIDDIEGVETALHNYGLGADDVDLLVATDAEAILGIGDWGANGIAISIAKLAVYTAAAGRSSKRTAARRQPVAGSRSKRTYSGGASSNDCLRPLSNRGSATRA